MMRGLHFFKNLFRSKALSLYTDGSHKGKWGSWAFVVVQNNRIIHEASGRVRRTTSHRMEFQAAIEALNYLKPGQEVDLFTDSKILLDCAVHDERPRINPDQSEVLFELLKKHKINWNWVRAHSGNEFNERCDQLCIQARS